MISLVCGTSLATMNAMVRLSRSLFYIITAVIVFNAHGSDDCQVSNISEIESTEEASFELYKSPGREQFVLFSTHNLTRDDVKLKNLKRELKGKLSEFRQDRLPRFILSELKSNAHRVQLDRFLVNSLEVQHKIKPFEYVAGEFSQADESRYQARIDTANFVHQELLKQTTLTESDIDDYILMLTGEDVYPLLKGNFLANLPRHFTEKAELLKQSSTKLSQCHFIKGKLKISSTPLGKQLSERLEQFFRPNLMDKQKYIEFRDQLILELQRNGLLRIQAGILEPENIESAVSSCDYLFDLKRDTYLANRMLYHAPSGRGLITRGIGHQHLLRHAFLNRCENRQLSLNDK